MFFEKKEPKINDNLYFSQKGSYNFNVGLKEVTRIYVEMTEAFGRAIGVTPVNDGLYVGKNYVGLIEVENMDNRFAVGMKNGDFIYDKMVANLYVCKGYGEDGYQMEKMDEESPEFDMFADAANKFLEENHKEIFSSKTEKKLDVPDFMKNEEERER